jgi:uncharacterized OB-fold protein
MAKICDNCGVIRIAAKETCPVCKSNDFEEKQIMIRKFTIQNDANRKKVLG